MSVSKKPINIITSITLYINFLLLEKKLEGIKELQNNSATIAVKQK